MIVCVSCCYCDSASVLRSRARVKARVRVDPSSASVLRSRARVRVDPSSASVLRARARARARARVRVDPSSASVHLEEHPLSYHCLTD